MKNTVLIVDDTYEKTEIIAKIISNIENCNFECCISSKDAISKMRDSHYDLLVVDLQIPLEVGAPIDQNGGKDLIEYCTRSDSINRPTHIVAVTSHKDSFDEHFKYFDDRGWPLLLGINNNEKLQKIIETKIYHSYPKSIKADLAIITALHKVELEAVLELPINWTERFYPDDNNTYYWGEIERSNGEKFTIVATSCSRMGMASAAATTMKVCSKFKPKIAIMTGIAAGVEGKTQFGDVLVADPCWDWGSGKNTVVDGEEKMLNAPHQISLDTVLRAKFQKISASRKYLDEIFSKWPIEQRPHSPLKLHIGPIATGAVVLENPKTVEQIISQHRETIGVEMEAYGFCYAATIADSKDIKPIVIKSVCDFANPDKNNDWQKYAAYTSARLMYMFIKEEL
jgi:nucleoside phosphorylase